MCGSARGLETPARQAITRFNLDIPESSVRPIVDEALGLTNDKSPYVYLSDGGHFENLGLYEMVLRRCHFIVVSDAGSDPECSFADLGESVRKIRVDFGIPIDFDQMNIYPRSQIDAAKKRGRNCAIGRIRYSAVDGSTAPDGIIVYIKPACYGDEPRDIYEYFKRSETFPHESTADQFFSNRSSKAIGCLARTRWRNSARTAAVIFGASLARSSRRTCRLNRPIGWQH